jgi:hypothetical protein
MTTGSTPRRSRGSVLAVAGAILALLGAGAPGAGAPALRIGQPAPDVAGGPWIGSEPLTIEALRGRVVLVEFWTHG